MEFVPYSENKVFNAPLNFQAQIFGLIDREIRMGHITDVSEVDYEALYRQAAAKKAKIEAAGLTISVRPDDEIRGFMVTRLDHLHPHSICNEFDPVFESRIIRCIYEDRYYGSTRTDSPKFTPLINANTAGPFTENDLGEIFFVVEDKNALGHRSDIPGSMFTNMKWIDQVAAFAEWKAAHSTAGKIMSLDYASQGMLLMHDLCSPYLLKNTLGAASRIRFIEQPFVENQFYPYYCVLSGDFYWSASHFDNYDDNSNYDCVVIALVG